MLATEGEKTRGFPGDPVLRALYCHCWGANPAQGTKILHVLWCSQKRKREIQEVCSCAVQFSRSVVSDSLRPHGLQHARPSCPSPTPGVYSNSCPSSQWCHPTISSSVPFSLLQSFPASGSFQMSQLFISGDQSIGVSLSTSVLPMNIQDWFPLGWIGWMSLQSKGLSRVFSNTTVCRISKIISCLGPIFMLCSELPADLSFQSEPSQCCSADMTVYI